MKDRKVLIDRVYAQMEKIPCFSSYYFERNSEIAKSIVDICEKHLVQPIVEVTPKSLSQEEIDKSVEIREPIIKNVQAFKTREEMAKQGIVFKEDTQKNPFIKKMHESKLTNPLGYSYEEIEERFKTINNRMGIIVVDDELIKDKRAHASIMSIMLVNQVELGDFHNSVNFKMIGKSIFFDIDYSPIFKRYTVTIDSSKDDLIITSIDKV